MKIKVVIDATTEMIEILKALHEFAIDELLRNPYNVYSLDDITVHDKSVTTEIDTSYHGSPVYKDEILTEDTNKVQMIRAIKELQKAYFNYAKENNNL